MRRIFLTLSLVCGALFHAQTSDCDAIKKENERLKDLLGRYGITTENNQPSMTSFNSDIPINFIKAIGNKEKQTVTIYFNVFNPDLPHQKFMLLTEGQLNGNLIYTTAYDGIGKVYEPSKAVLGSLREDQFNHKGFGKVLKVKLDTGAHPIMATVTFEGVISSKVSVFNNVNIIMDTMDFSLSSWADSKKIGVTTFNNVKIDWE